MSKRRSSTSTPPEAAPVLYLDENIGRDIARELRRFSEWRIEVHRDHFPHSPDGRDQSVPDTAVLRKCGEEGWILITCDDKMRSVPEHRRVAAEHGTKVFAFPDGNHNGTEMSAALIAGRFRLLGFARKYAGPFFARIRLSGEVHHLDRDRKSPQTSREKTASKYGSKVLRGIAVGATRHVIFDDE